MASNQKRLYRDYIGKPLRMMVRTNKKNLVEKTVVIEDVTDFLVVGLEMPRDIAKADTAIILKEEIIYHVQNESIGSLKEKITQKKRFIDKVQSQETINRILKRLDAAENKRKSTITKGADGQSF